MEKGKTVIGGGLSFQLENHAFTGADNLSSKGFSIQPTIGWFLSDRFALGIGVGYTHSTVSHGIDAWTGDEIRYKNNTVSFHPYGRYFFGNNESALRFHLTGSLYAGFGHSDSGHSMAPAWNSSVYGIQLSPGIVYFPTDKIGLELGVGGLSYYHNRSQYEGSDDVRSSNSFGFNINSLSPSIGIQFYL